MSRKLTFIDLLGGIGVGTKAVLNRAGQDNVDIVSYIDNEYNNDSCVSAYNLFYGTNYTPTDINTFDFNNINKHIDLAMASVPSNTFTDNNFILGHKEIAKKLWGKQDIAPRLSIAQALLDFYKQCEPTAFVIDFTLGQHKKEQEKNLQILLDKFKELGASIGVQTYNAYEFNAPQKRERECALIFNKTITLSKPFEFPTGVKTPLKVKDILLDNYSDDVIISNYEWETKYKDSLFIHKVWNINDYLNTITANYGCHNAGHSAVVPCKDESGWRFLMPLEVFRAMGLKDDYYNLLENNFTNEQLYRLAGNSMIGNYIDRFMQQLLNKKELRVWED